MRMTMRSRIHVVLVRVSEFHPCWKVMVLIHVRRTPAFFVEILGIQGIVGFRIA